ncbi:MAG: adenosylmethionine decarboxylase [Pseudomonadota bacterium]|nr:adenosylmethionine decarboxylase [Pseudomonadota bacterium]
MNDLVLTDNNDIPSERTASISENPGVSVRKRHSRQGLGNYLICKDGEVYAGAHLLVDVWGGKNIGDPDAVAEILKKAAEGANATILHVHVHEFGGEGGISGVAVLAESHISVHTWPELDYAAFDVFMCGNCRPEKAVAVLEQKLEPVRIEVNEQKRGLVG